MKVLDLVLLVNDGPTAKAYIKYMEKSGYKPKKVLLLNFRIVGGLKAKVVDRFLGQGVLRKLVAFRDSKVDRDDWHLYSEMLDAEKDIDLSKSISYKDHCLEYDEILISSVNDIALKEYVERETTSIFVFTGGGILKRDILSVPGKKFIHVHPGIVPDIRGSDGLFWSLLLRGRPGMSCFYMDDGIDTGSVLFQHEFDAPKIKITNLDVDYDIVRRVLLKFYDPKLRALTLVSLLKKLDQENVAFDEASMFVQEGSGRTYFSMHRVLLKKVVSKLMCSRFK